MTNATTAPAAGGRATCQALGTVSSNPHTAPCGQNDRHPHFMQKEIKAQRV